MDEDAGGAGWPSRILPKRLTYAENTPITVAVGTYRRCGPRGRRHHVETWAALTLPTFSISSGGVLTFKKSPDFEMQMLIARWT